MVTNIHTRTIEAPAQDVGELLDALASDHDMVWPREDWPPLRLKPDLCVGAQGGHGPVRYQVLEHDPGRRVQFQFQHPRGFLGTHVFRLESDSDTRSTLSHAIHMSLRGTARLTWPLFLRPLHDALIEEAFDKVERHFAPDLRHPSRRSPWVRFLRRVTGISRKISAAKPSLAGMEDRNDVDGAAQGSHSH